VRKPGKQTQRERLIAAIVTVAGERGHEGTSVSAIIARAGVSRASFYEHFADKGDGLLAASSEIEQRLLAEVRSAIGQAAPEHAAPAAIEALVGFSRREPAMARLVMGETLAGAEPLLEHRDHAVGEIAQEIEAAYERAETPAVLPDLSPAALIGGTQRVLARGLRRGELPSSALSDGLIDWVQSYRAPRAEHRWRTLDPLPVPSRSPLPALSPLRPPRPLPTGRPRAAAPVLAENRRQRILFAAAEVLQDGGCSAGSVSAISARAGVDRRGFHALFADRSEVFTAVHELCFQHAMAVTAGAYFCAEDWPKRVWQAGRALTQHLEQNPLLSRVSLLEGHAGGPEAAQRVEDLLGAFTIFLHDGYQQSPVAGGPSAVALEALAATAFEIAYRHARERRRDLEGLSGLLGHLTHLCLAPFLGSAAANEHIEGMGSAGGSQRARGALSAQRQRDAQPGALRSGA
jgi:AcrR family transcriptional regulator